MRLLVKPGLAAISPKVKLLSGGKLNTVKPLCKISVGTYGFEP
jgi:hypothetical protein